MCIIIAQKIGAPTLEKDALEQAWNRNSDGGGYAFIRNGEIVMRKPFFKAKHMIKAYLQDHKRYGAASPFVVHMRIATHGSKTFLNTHPHVTGLEGKAVLAHNGVIQIAIPTGVDWSDTVAFCDAVTDSVPSEELVSGKWTEQIEQLIGFSNKLAIIATNGGLAIFNEKQGHWSKDKAVWYSNYSYETWKARNYKPYVAPDGTVWDKQTGGWIPYVERDDDDIMYGGYCGSPRTEIGWNGAKDSSCSAEDADTDDAPLLEVEDMTDEELIEELARRGAITEGRADFLIEKMVKGELHKVTRDLSVSCVHCSTKYTERAAALRKLPWFCMSCQDVVKCVDCKTTFHTSGLPMSYKAKDRCVSCAYKHAHPPDKELQERIDKLDAQLDKIESERSAKLAERMEKASARVALDKDNVERVRRRILRAVAIDNGVPVAELEGARVRGRSSLRTITLAAVTSSTQSSVTTEISGSTETVWFRCNGCAQKYSPLANAAQKKRPDLCLVCCNDGTAARFPLSGADPNPYDVYARTCSRCKVRFAPGEDGFRLLCPPCSKENQEPLDQCSNHECGRYFDRYKNGCLIDGKPYCGTCWQDAVRRNPTGAFSVIRSPPVEPSVEVLPVPMYYDCDSCSMRFAQPDEAKVHRRQGWILCDECEEDKLAVEMGIIPSKDTGP